MMNFICHRYTHREKLIANTWGVYTPVLLNTISIGIHWYNIWYACLIWLDKLIGLCVYIPLFHYICYKDQEETPTLWHLWCDLGESVWSQTCDIFSFLFDWTAHLEKHILLKTSPELDQWFQGYEQLRDSQNNRKQKEIISFFWLYFTINVADFQLILLDRNTF